MKVIPPPKPKQDLKTITEKKKSNSFNIRNKIREINKMA